MGEIFLGLLGGCLKGVLQTSTNNKDFKYSTKKK